MPRITRKLVNKMAQDLNKRIREVEKVLDVGVGNTDTPFTRHYVQEMYTYVLKPYNVKGKNRVWKYDDVKKLVEKGRKSKLYIKDYYEEMVALEQTYAQDLDPQKAYARKVEEYQRFIVDVFAEFGYEKGYLNLNDQTIVAAIRYIESEMDLKTLKNYYYKAEEMVLNGKRAEKGDSPKIFEQMMQLVLDDMASEQPYKRRIGKEGM